MFLFTLVLGVLFLPEVDNLKCECVPGPNVICSEETTNCSSQFDRCSVATQVTVEGGKVSEDNYTGCFMSDLCLNQSVSYRVYRIALNTSCCTGDLCNAQINYPKPEYKFISNSRKCFTCDEENCMKTVSCAGDENYCFKATANAFGVTGIFKGCASESCSVLSAVLVNQFTGAKISCCQGDYCNSASSASPILMLLLVPLLFSALFS